MRHFITVIICFWVLISGCSPSERGSEPLRILSLSAAATGILYDLGVPPVAIDEYGLIAVKDSSSAVIGKGSLVSREKIVELNINCVILWEYQKSLASDLRKRGIQIIPLSPFRLRDYPLLVKQLGDLTGKHVESEQMIAAFQQKMSAFSDTGKKIPVYFELYGSFQSAGEESYIGDLLSCSGGVPLTRKTGIISAEKVLKSDPAVIFYVDNAGSLSEIRKRPGFSRLSAVKNNRIYAIPRRLITEGIAPDEAISLLRKYILTEK